MRARARVLCLHVCGHAYSTHAPACISNTHTHTHTHRLDEDESGAVDREEFVKGLQQLHVDLTEMQVYARTHCHTHARTPHAHARTRMHFTIGWHGNADPSDFQGRRREQQ